MNTNTTGAKTGTAAARMTRTSWLEAGFSVLISEGIEQVKIMRLAEDLGVARSSFYWFFESRDELQAALLGRWAQKNTGAIVARAKRKSGSIAGAVLNVFECWIDEGLFDARLDFAIREWARRDVNIRDAISKADAARVSALSEMFQRFDFPLQEAFIRARILYFTQVGYYSLVDYETTDVRQRYVDDYILGFTGQTPTAEERARFDKILANS